MLAIDKDIDVSLRALAADPHVTQWAAKENNWVNYFAFRHLLPRWQPGGVLYDPAQISIEVSVPQPDGYKTRGVRRDLVIWSSAGMTCWDSEWSARGHPLAILEWKVHRPGRKNKRVNRERAWLKAYCSWQPSVVGYAIEVDGTGKPTTIKAARFCGKEHDQRWLELNVTRS